MDGWIAGWYLSEAQGEQKRTRAEWLRSFARLEDDRIVLNGRLAIAQDWHRVGESHGASCWRADNAYCVHSREYNSEYVR